MIKNESRLSVIEEQLRENSREHCDIKTSISEIKTINSAIAKDLYDLKTNHIVFKTRVFVYWGVGVAVLSSIIQILVSWIIKHV
jgi:hypothetical protein